MAAMASSADVPTVVYHKGLEKFGICLEKQKQVYKFLHPYSDSYLNGIYMAPKKEVTDTHLSYFMSYQSVINREPDGFILTDNSTLIPTTVERMSCATQALSAFDPVPAKYQDEVGIIFPNTASLVDHFFAGLCDVLDPDYCIPDNIADDQVAFLAFRPLLKAAVGEDPLRLLPRSEVQIFRLDAGNEVNDKQLNQSVLKSNKKGKKAAPNSVSFKQAPTVLANTPAVPFALGKRVSRSGGSSEGNTTIASSSECDQDQADNSLLTSSNYSILNRSAASSSPAHTAGSSDDEAELRAQGGVKSEAGQDAPHAHLRIPGPSDVLNAEMVHATAPRETADQIALRKEEIRAIIDRNWDFMKTGLQWGKFHVRPGQKSASLLELFVVPLPRQHCTVLKDLQLIENLEYFHEKESFLKHCKENPCLVEDWKYLWPRLKAAGWEHVKPQEEKGGESARPFFYPPFVARYFLEGDGEKSVECLRKRGLVPGTHLFVSRVSVSRFIARFPHLLQTDEQLVVTLRRYGWEVEETAGKGAKALWVYLEQDSSWRKSKKATEWVGLEELRRRLWMTPTRLFQHLADFTKQGAVGKVDVYGSGAKVQPLCQALLLQAVCLLEDDALAEETEDNSPTVQGLSQKSMEEAVKAVTNYTQGSDKEDSKVGSLLLKLEWGRKKATWTSMWWRTEECWVAPWFDQITAPQANRDYFFSLSSVARYAKHAKYADVLLVQPRGYSGINVSKELRAMADNKLRVIANRKDHSFTRWPVHEMLASTGWVVVETGGGGVYVPYWKAAQIGASNYGDFEQGVDYFGVDSHEDIFDHLASNGNAAAVVPEAMDIDDDESSCKAQKVEKVEKVEGAQKVEKGKGSKTPKAAAKSEPDSTSSQSTTSRVEHLGEYYEADSVAGRILQVPYSSRHFGTVYTLLGKMGWFSGYDSAGSYLCPPWARSVEGAIAPNKRILDLSLLLKDVDYFDECKEGKDKLLLYVEINGFDRYPAFGGGAEAQEVESVGEGSEQSGGMDVVQEVEQVKASPKAKKARKTPKAKVVVEVELGTDSTSSSVGVEHLGEYYETDSVAGRVVTALTNGRHFCTVYTLLGKMGWFSGYDRSGSYLCPPWARSVEGAVAGKRILDLSLLLKGVDFFDESAEGKDKLLLYVEFNGFDRYPAFEGAMDASLSFSPSEEAEVEVEVGGGGGGGGGKEVSGDSDYFKQVKDVHHKGVLYAEQSAPWMVLNCIERGDRFGYMWTWLQQEPLFFAQHYCPQMRETLLCAGWALNIPGAFSSSSSATYKLADVSALTRNVDYFPDTDEGKDALVTYITNNGFERVTESADSGNSAGNSGGNSRGRGSRRRGGDPSKIDPEFAIDWAALKKVIQVGRLQVSDADQLWNALRGANKSWSCFADSKGRAVYSRGCDLYHLPSHVEGVDYFRSLQEVQAFVTRQATLHRDQRFLGYTEGTGYLSDEEEEKGGEKRDPSTYLTMHKRSPIKPVYRAGEAGVHIDRLVAAPSPASPSPLSSTNTSNTVTPEHFKSAGGERVCDYPFELDMQHVIDALQSPSPDAQAETRDDGDTDFIPLTQNVHAFDEMSEEEEGEDRGDGIRSLLQSQDPNFNRIFQVLSSMDEPWSYFYLSMGTNLSNLECCVGRDTVYFRPGCGFHSTGMVKDEDYFFSPASLMDYLRVQYGLQSMPEHQSTSKKPRATRSGRTLEVQEVEEEASESEVRGKRRGGSQGAEAPMAKKQKVPPSSMAAQAVTVEEPVGVVCLGDRLQQVRALLKTAAEHSAYQGRGEGTAAVGRGAEHTRILQVVAAALTNAQGVGMYLCGSPGVGKTLTVVNVLHEVARCRRQTLALPHRHTKSSHSLLASTRGRGRVGMEVDFLDGEAGSDLGYRVVCLNGAHLRKKRDAYVTLLEQLRIPVDSRTDVAQCVADYFSCQGQGVALTLPAELGVGVQDRQGGSSADSSPSQADFKGRSKKRRAMTVLVVDEIDMADEAFVAHLMALSSSDSDSDNRSSLVLLGLGNNITLLSSMRDRHPGVSLPEQLVFRHYDLASLQAIVQAATADLFDGNSRKMLASKVMKSFKGDIRALLTLAIKCLDEGARQVAEASNSEELLAGPSKPIVSMAVLTKACAQKDPRVDIIGALTPKTKLLLVALLVETVHCEGGLKKADMVRAFNGYCDQKGLSAENSAAIYGYLEELLVYNVASLVTKSNNPEKSKYMVNVAPQFVLQADIGELHAQELRRLVARQEKNRDAAVMSQFY